MAVARIVIFCEGSRPDLEIVADCDVSVLLAWETQPPERLPVQVSTGTCIQMEQEMEARNRALEDRGK